MEIKNIQDVLNNNLADDGVYAVNGKFIKELCNIVASTEYYVLERLWENRRTNNERKNNS